MTRLGEWLDRDRLTNHAAWRTRAAWSAILLSVAVVVLVLVIAYLAGP